MVLECQTREQAEIISEQILRGRTPEVFINLDLTAQPPGLGVYLKVDDPNGIPLTREEVESLYQMVQPGYVAQASHAGPMTRVMFGNVVDIDMDQLTGLVRGRTAHGRFNIMIGMEVREGRGLFFKPEGLDPVVVECTSSYSTEPWEVFCRRMVHTFRNA
ncbi:hypothetical protein ACFL0L_00645 [Patescibacteria group bacterium]